MFEDQNRNESKSSKLDPASNPRGEISFPDVPSEESTKRRHRILRYIKAHPRKTALIVLLILALVGATGWYAFTRSDWFVKRLDTDTTVIEQTEPETVPSPLTGVEVEPRLANRPTIGVMIENSPDARPQSSLGSAGVVFEAVTEGGITRFLALYQEASPGKIGPVRSLRNHFVDWVMSFDAGIAHVGGSAQALDLIRNRNGKDLDQFAGGQYFYRSSDRFAPHNMYTSTQSLREFNKARGYDRSEYEPWLRKDDSPLETPRVSRISVDYSGPSYNVTFRYRKDSNDYARIMAGEQHIDRETGKVISPKNIAVMRMPTTYEGKYAIMPTIGSGEAFVFKDGDIIKGRWRQDSYREIVRFYDADGSEVEFNRGQTWIAVSPNDRPLTHE